ncbi:hypothetical protein [Shimia sp.]|uniref:tetratricopeptide repeat protein n=1 Tax=Shimia sp. TaxID=1954381 RepID=UPI00329A5C57
MVKAQGQKAERKSPLVCSKTEAEDAVSRILTSPEFRQANRLKEFLSYVVTETVDGRGAEISGRTIAQDVYHRGHTGSDSDLSVVRVDAGRLRRRLVEYYSVTGQFEPFQISIPTGSYAPLISKMPSTQISDQKPTVTPISNKWTLSLLFLILGGAVTFGVYFLADRHDQQNSVTATPSGEDQSAARMALLGKSPASLQAVNQAEQARALLFPALDPKRLLIVARLFEHAVELDDQYYGGYAGAAQVYAILSVLSPSKEKQIALSERAVDFAERAISLSPTSGWAQSAAALVALCQKDFVRANRRSIAATSLSPQDSYVWEVDAVIALFSGEFERALSSADPKQLLNRSDARSPNRSILGAAYFHLSNYKGTVNQFEDAIAMGDPVSQVSVFYLVAAYQSLGQEEKAQDMARYYKQAWPNQPAEQFLAHVYHPKVDLAHAVSLVSQAGLTWQTAD